MTALTTSPAATSTAGLSVQQRSVLLHLYRLKQEQEQEYDGHPLREYVLLWGVPWHVTGTRSEQASVSRTLARLESRGLILRQNVNSGCPDTGCLRKSAPDPHNRTTGVVVLRDGVDLAKRLTTDTGVRC